MWIKICGMTSPEAVAAALEARADAVGFVFAESARRLTPQRAAQLAKPARDRVRCVAVTRHPTQSAVDEILEVFAPDVLQTDLTDLERLTLPAGLGRLPVLRAGGEPPATVPRRVLFEGPRSGSGAVSDWNAARDLARRTQLVLAGGLNAGNVAAAIAAVRPFGVDVSSGVELEPGIKNPLEIAGFVRAARVWLKREDLAHTGAHKINNAMGQALLAKRLGAKRVVAETGAGQHGVASAAACARLGLPCTVYMGSIDMERQAPNVGRMRLLGAEVVPVTSGDRTLRAAIDEALRDWVSDPRDTYYLLGSVVGPHPYPYLVRELQAVIGREARAQMLAATGALPDALIACVGGGSNSMGTFHAFIP